MPFETSAVARKTIAVIGSGISGMGAAHRLADTHNVTLFEAEPRLGGHARTIIAGKRGDQPVDTGFIVFNYANYPNLADLFARLDVPVVKSNMSFGASVRGGALEYGLASAGAFFAQRRNALNPRFLRMLRDIFRFNACALDHAGDRGLTIGQFLDKIGTGDYFRDFYLLPLSGAIWSTPTEQILDFPAHAMIRFFENHALLNYSGQHQWYTVEGGSVEYVSRLEQAMRRKGVSLALGVPIAGVRRTELGVEIRVRGGEWQVFDVVVFATHSDTTLALLSDATRRESAALGAVRYQPNEAVLHSDPALMPKRRKCWASWNHTEEKGANGGPIGLTYWMNSLQPIPQDDPLFVTLNASHRIHEEHIHDVTTFAHPVFDAGALAAQEDLARMNGTNSTWFCGAWMKNGFHEDGLASAIDVVAGINRTAALPVAAE